MKTESLDRYSKVLDVQDLMSRCMGNIEFACRVLQILSERCDSDIDGLEQAAAQQDFDQIYHISHRLKGAFANASATNMSRLADEVCTASRAKNESDSLEKTCKLRDEWDEFIAMVRNDVDDVN
ncbi:Hpt domain-containing protein [Aeoliella sp.]|uniref:Hpt domain-containing protein n=1 Tax=Aeoliella sp. TaxID=2795800 RepID=UPI003CCB96B0